MTHREYLNSVKGKIDDTITELKKFQAKIDSNNKQIDSGMFKPEYCNELRRANRSISYDQTMFRQKALKEIEDISNAYSKELKLSNCLKGDQLTDDVKLLTCGVRLTDKDLMGIIERNKGNDTMEQIVSRYAQENKIDIPFVYVPENLQLASRIKGYTQTADVVMKHFDKQNVYDELMGVFD